MDPLSDACLSLNVKDADSAQVHTGGCWVTRVPSCGDMTFSANLQGSDWLSIDGIDHPMRIAEGNDRAPPLRLEFILPARL
jgi:hypothetical protein